MAISDGDMASMESWQDLEVRDFFMALWSQQDMIEKRIEAMKKKPAPETERKTPQSHGRRQ